MMSTNAKEVIEIMDEFMGMLMTEICSEGITNERTMKEVLLINRFYASMKNYMMCEAKILDDINKKLDYLIRQNN